MGSAASFFFILVSTISHSFPLLRAWAGPRFNLLSRKM
jgi:hypothetical protein